MDWLAINEGLCLTVESGKWLLHDAEVKMIGVRKNASPDNGAKKLEWLS